MSALSNYMEEKIVEHFFRGNSVTPPTNVYMALYESNPGESNTGTETSYTNYVRKAATFTAIDTNGQTKNSAQIAFEPNGNASAAVVITHVALFDSATAGNMLVYGALSTPKTIQKGDVLSYAINAFQVTFD